MPFIISHSKEQVCYITLNRPDKFNSFCREMAFELHAALDAAENDPEIRCLVISGEGKAFCAGQDLAEAIEDNGIELAQIVAEHYNPIIERIRKIEKPVIAAVNGLLPEQEPILPCAAILFWPAKVLPLFRPSAK
jgi:2-(1,2-epoxy-1,2-dihydrophenyl)acetyl-CoA isomerase